DVAKGGRDRLDVAGLQPRLATFGLQPAIVAHAVALSGLRAPQHPDQAPDAVVMDRRALARAPDEAHQAEPLDRIAMQEVLLVELGMRLRERLGQPAAVRDQLGEEPTPALEQ